MPESHAEDDRKFRELVDARNQSDGLVHAAEKSLTDLGDKVEKEEREKVEEAIKALKDVIDGDDLGEIQTKSQALAEASAGIAQRMYEQAQAEGDQAEAGQAETGESKAEDGVVDAEFEEVDDDKSKSA